MTYRQLGGLDLEELRRRAQAAQREVSTVVRTAALLERPEVAERELTVPAYEKARTFYTIDKEGNRVPSGTAIRRDYDTDRKVAHATMRGTDGRDYVIGQMSQLWDVVDHADVAAPLMDAGFTDVQLLKHHAGGTSMFAVLVNPDVNLAEVIDWDGPLFSQALSPAHGYQTVQAPLSFAVRVESSLRYGEALHITYGIFRWRCYNGIITAEMDFGNQTFNHTQFRRAGGADDFGQRVIRERVNRILDDIDRAGGDLTKLPALSARVDSRALDWSRDLLARYGENPVEGMARIEALPDFAKRPLLTLFNRMPTWAPNALGTVMDHARNADDLGMLDLVNIVTNTAAPQLQPNQVRGRLGGDPSWTIYERLDPLTQAFKDVVDIGAFRAGVSWSKN